MASRISTDSSSEEEQVEITTKLFLWDFNQCDPKKCTGKKLVRLKLCRQIPVGKKIPGLVLSPLATQTLSPSDGDIVRTRGLGVIDCSWAKVDSLPTHKLKSGDTRLLPYLGTQLLFVFSFYLIEVKYRISSQYSGLRLIEILI